MNQIQAIETVYKGYRFRSRLEARWALFYDLIGAQWTYEPDPVRVNGEAYLPDFRVQLAGHEICHEVKPPNAKTWIKAPLVYLAGKMCAEHDWRGEASPLSRDTRNDVFELTNPRVWLKNAQQRRVKGSAFVLVGPFPTACDHGCAHYFKNSHMAETCSSLDERELIDVCRMTIANCDIFCAHISTPDAFGTLVEIGYASVWDKLLSVTVDSSITQKPDDFESHGRDYRHEFWFAQKIAKAGAVVSGYDEAQQFHADYIRQNTAKEYRKIAGIGMATGYASLTFGDPYEVATESGNALEWGVSMRRVCSDFHDHAVTARSHRFDRH